MGVYYSNKKATDNKKDEFNYEIIQECGDISTKTYTTRNGEEVTEVKKLRLISWNGNDPKYDIRPWKITDEGEKCLKAGGLTGEELVKLGELITALQQEEEKPKTKTKTKDKSVACSSKRTTTTTTKPNKATAKAKTTRRK